MKKLLAIALAVSVFLLGGVAAAEAATGTVTVCVSGEEWGPAIPYVVLAFDKDIDASSLAPEDFSVVAHQNGFVMGTDVTSEGDVPHVVLAASLCDEAGNAVDAETGKFVRLDLQIHPDGVTNKTYVMGTFPDGTPIKAGGVNVWYEGFTETVTLAEGATITSGGAEIDAIEISPDFAVVEPDVEGWTLDQRFTASDGTPFNYATFSPAEDDKQNALVIWLHGAGECGLDSTIDLLSNESVDIAKSPIQDYFGGAYVLAPQCETMWMDDNDPDGDGNFYTATGLSVYTAALQELVESCVAGNPDIDPNRVIIGGCSNGGFMTVNMLVNYPGYYAAAYPICQAYLTDWITPDEIEALKAENIWFVHCLTDTTVDPQATTVYLIL
jgi:predicted peptidase